MRSAALLLLIGKVAAADGPPSVDVRDLPPLPEVSQSDTVANIAVVGATKAEEDTVVGAAKREQSLGNVASAVTVLSGDRLRRFGYRTVAEALRAVAGVYVMDDRMYNRLGIRGIQLLGDFNTHILVLVDGATINEPWDQYVGIGDDSPVNLDDVERIEIVRGPVSSVYGTNAFLCIINIVTKSADQTNHVYARAGGGTIMAGGVDAGFAQGTVNRQVRGSFSFRDRKGESLAPSDVFGTDGITAYNGSVVGRWDGFFAQVRGYYHLRQLAGSPYGVLPDPRNTNLDEQLMVEAGYTKDFSSKVTLVARGYFGRYQFQDHLIYDNTMGFENVPGNTNFRDIGNSVWAGGELRVLARLLPRDLFNLTTGVEMSANEVSSQSFEVDTPPGPGDFSTPKTDFELLGVYAEGETRPVPWATASAGLRFDYNTKFDKSFSPRLALLFHQADSYGLKLLFAQGFRNPSPYEAFFDDGETAVGNPALRPEHIASYEGVLWAKPFGGLNVRLSGFWWHLTDMIGAGTVTVAGRPMEQIQFQNQSQIDSRGGEVELGYRDVRGWYGFGSATIAKVTTTDDAGVTADAINAPLVTATAGASTPKLFKLLHISTELELLSSRLTRDPAVTAAPFLRWNAALYLPEWHHLDVTIGVHNILGQREEVPAQSDFDRTDSAGNTTITSTLPGEGREAYARVGGSF